jgi:hypothetical protein
MIKYDELNERQKELFQNATDALQTFRVQADAIMYYSFNPLSEENQQKFREAYDLVCQAMDIIN